MTLDDNLSRRGGIERRLFVVRHAETYANRYGSDARLHAPAGVPEGSLTDRGKLQARALAAYLTEQPFSAVFSSSAPRCIETLAPFLEIKTHRSPPVAVRDELLEIKNDNIAILVGFLEGRPPVRGSDWHEEPADYLGRIRGVLDEILSITEGDVLVVAHHGTNNTILSILANASGWKYQHQENACVNVVTLRNDKTYLLKAVNSLSHLPRELQGTFSG